MDPALNQNKSVFRILVLWKIFLSNKTLKKRGGRPKLLKNVIPNFHQISNRVKKCDATLLNFNNFKQPYNEMITQSKHGFIICFSYTTTHILRVFDPLSFYLMFFKVYFITFLNTLNNMKPHFEFL